MQKPFLSGSRITVHVSEKSPMLSDLVSTSWPPSWRIRLSSGFSVRNVDVDVDRHLDGLDFSIRLKRRRVPSPRGSVAIQLSPAEAAS